MGQISKARQASDELLMVRVDANPSVGAGHFMRCLALVEAWRDRGNRSIIVTSHISHSLHRRADMRMIEFVEVEVVPGSNADVQSIVNLTQRHSPAWVVLDGYSFDMHFQQDVKDAGHHKLLVIDDVAHLSSYVAHALLNQNPFASSEMYSTSKVERFLLGPKYALLRSEFKNRQRSHSASKYSMNILVTFGGADEANVTETVLRGLRALNGRFQVKVVVGPLNPHRERLQATSEELGLSCTWVTHSSFMPEAMQWADLAITGSGSTCWELAYLGIPMVCVVVADNQRGIASHLAQIGAALDAGPREDLHPDDISRLVGGLLVDPSRLGQMGRRGRHLVDGRGSSRVVGEMLAAL